MCERCFFFEKKIQLNSSGKEKHNCRTRVTQLIKTEDKNKISLYVYVMIQILLLFQSLTSVCFNMLRLLFLLLFSACTLFFFVCCSQIAYRNPNNFFLFANIKQLVNTVVVRHRYNSHIHRFIYSIRLNSVSKNRVVFCSLHFLFLSLFRFLSNDSFFFVATLNKLRHACYIQTQTKKDGS